jgi:hypothetical protein
MQDDTESLEEEIPPTVPTLRLDLAATHLTTNPSRLRGWNTASGTLGVKSPVPVTVLCDTGSDASFISPRIVRQCEEGRRLQLPPAKVRLTDGTSAILTEGIRVCLRLGDFTTVMVLRILPWETYDMIFGEKDLRERHALWDIGNGTITLRNGSNKSATIQLRPHRSVDYAGLEAEGINAISYRTARRYLRRADTERDLANIPTLVVVRDSKDLGKKRKRENETDNEVTLLPRVDDHRFLATVREHQSRFREELPSELPPDRGIRHEIDTGDARPVNRPPYRQSWTHNQWLA